MPRCEHFDGVTLAQAPEAADACPACVESGSRWVHLRMCLVCGQVGCCDSSPNRHARAHHERSGHQLLRSVESGEDWGYCYSHDQYTRLTADEGGSR